MNDDRTYTTIYPSADKAVNQGRHGRQIKINYMSRRQTRQTEPLAVGRQIKYYIIYIDTNVRTT